jgi:hypothetical protein
MAIAVSRAVAAHVAQSKQIWCCGTGDRKKRRPEKKHRKRKPEFEMTPVVQTRHVKNWI